MPEISTYVKYEITKIPLEGTFFEYDKEENILVKNGHFRSEGNVSFILVKNDHLMRKDVSLAVCWSNTYEAGLDSVFYNNNTHTHSILLK